MTLFPPLSHGTDDVRFVVRRVVVLGIARGQLNIRFGHCTSCLFDNSSVKLCKHDTPFHSCRKARMMSRVWGWTALAKRSGAMKAPVGLLSGSAVLRKQDGGPCPDKRYPNKITSEMQTHCRSEVPDGQEIFKN